MGRRLARVMVSAELVEGAFTGAMPDGVWARRDAGLPEGAKLVACDFYLDCATPEVMLVFEHESFRELAEGEAVPLVGDEHQPRWVSWYTSVSLDTKAVIDCAVKAAVKAAMESICAAPIAITMPAPSMSEEDLQRIRDDIEHGRARMMSGDIINLPHVEPTNLSGLQFAESSHSRCPACKRFVAVGKPCPYCTDAPHVVGGE